MTRLGGRLQGQGLGMLELKLLWDAVGSCTDAAGQHVSSHRASPHIAPHSTHTTSHDMMGLGMMLR